jgi:hypothetical protein
MIITDAQYVFDSLEEVNSAIRVTIDGTEVTVPLDPANRHYAEILKQVADGTLTIADAD